MPWPRTIGNGIAPHYGGSSWMLERGVNWSEPRGKHCRNGIRVVLRCGRRTGLHRLVNGCEGKVYGCCGLCGAASILLKHSMDQVAHHFALRKLPGTLLLLIALTGCGTMNVSSCRGDGQVAVQELLYFGTEKPTGHVTTEDWTQFLDEIVTPRFPAGISAWQASGQWRSVSGEVSRELSYVLSLVHPDDAAPNKAVQEIILSYKTRFQQRAVLRVKSNVCMSL